MLLDKFGRRKYLTRAEWRTFLAAANKFDPSISSFCWTLAYTGGRLSEVRALTPQSIDIPNKMIVIECLKRRKKGVFRAIPVPPKLIKMLNEVHRVSALKKDALLNNARLWPWSRTTAWAHVKRVCLAAGVPPTVAMPKAFRHTFGVEGAALAGVPLGTMKRWLGHARFESTLVYTEALGAEERALAQRMWRKSI